MKRYRYKVVDPSESGEQLQDRIHLCGRELMKFFGGILQKPRPSGRWPVAKKWRLVVTGVAPKTMRHAYQVRRRAADDDMEYRLSPRSRWRVVIPYILRTARVKLAPVCDQTYYVWMEER